MLGGGNQNNITAQDFKKNTDDSPQISQIDLDDDIPF